MKSPTRSTSIASVQNHQPELNNLKEAGLDQQVLILVVIRSEFSSFSDSTSGSIVMLVPFLDI